MMEARSGKRRFKLSKSKLPFLFLIVLLCYLAGSLATQFSWLITMQHKLENAEQRITELRQKNQELWDRLEYLSSDTYIEKQAREKLGLVKPGEVRIIPVPEEKQPVNDSIKD